MHGAAPVDAEHPLPFRPRELPRDAGQLDAGVVTQDVHCAEALDRAGLELVDRVPARDVGRHREHIAEPRRRRLERRRVDIGEDDPHACRGEGLAQREADATRGTGHDCDLVGELVHGY